MTVPLAGLRAALLAQAPDLAQWPLQPMAAKGLAHDHVRLVGSGLLARIPKQSQMRLGVQDNLQYQQACFDRAMACGHVPGCIQRLQPTAQLARGALLVQEIEGRPASLPEDLPRLMQTLAAIHALPVPSQKDAAPLLYTDDPLLAMLQEIKLQAAYMPSANLQSAVLQEISEELSTLQTLCETTARPERRLIAFDGHPGNYVVTQAGTDNSKAYLVDLEKCRYSYPGFDLAHATLYTSTTWDMCSHVVLSTEEVSNAYSSWEQYVGSSLAASAAPWHIALRRAMWLWSITWCAKWRVASQAATSLSKDDEDWSAEQLDKPLATHVKERVDHYLTAACVQNVRADFADLEASLA